MADNLPSAPPDPKQLKRELTIFFAGLCVLNGLAILLLRFMNDGERDPAVLAAQARVTLEIAINAGVFLTAAVMLALGWRWGALLGAGWSIVSIVLFLAAIAQNVGRIDQIGMPMVIWTLIALTIVRRTRLYLQAVDTPVRAEA